MTATRFILLTLLGTPVSLGIVYAADTLGGAAGVYSGDTVIVRGTKLRLFGVEAPGPREQCGSASSRWPCGPEAKAALREVVNGKELNCKLRHKVGHGYWQATCELDGRDVAEAQVRLGWARAVPAMTNSYIAAEKEASAAGRGLWRSQ